MNVADRWSIKTAVFIAPSIVIVLMLGAMLMFDQVLRRQQADYMQMVQGPLTRATSTTTRMLLAVSEVQAEVLRYSQLRQRFSGDDAVLRDLREGIVERYRRIAQTLETLKADASATSESDAVANIEDFLTIHRTVSLRMISGAPVDTTSISTLMAHYQQLQSYISEMAERSLESAQATVRETEATVSRLSNYLMIGSLIVILMSIAITVYVGRAITRPIGRMIDILSAIAAGERVNSVPGRERGDEIGAMARAIAVFDTVTRELRDHERDLEDARHAAESANAAKSAFLANVSHELRTPLTSILGFTHIIRRRVEQTIAPGIGPEDRKLSNAVQQVRDNVDIILAEGQRLTTLINNLLDLEKIEAGEMRWEIVPVNVADVTRQAADATRALYEAKGLSFEIDICDGVCAVMADRDRLVQVLINLISNAVKFTAHGGIRCAARALDDGTVEFSVEDTGCGIAAQDRPLVFEKFRQVGDTLTDKPTGTGLGLPICKEIVEHLGGTITVDSEPGVGSTFRFTLPVAVATPTTD